MTQRHEHHPPVIGLAGGVGSGKSTVAAEFARLGCAVVSADQLNHEVLGRPEVTEQLRKWWGDRILGPDGRVDRRVVGEIVFDDPRELKKLTDLVHPLIARRQQELIRQYRRDPRVKAIVLDVPLLFETGQNRLCDAVVFVSADEATRLERLGRARGWGAEHVKKVENLQLALDMKAKMSDYVIVNNSSIPRLAVQVAQVFSSVM